MSFKTLKEIVSIKGLPRSEVLEFKTSIPVTAEILKCTHGMINGNEPAGYIIIGIPADKNGGADTGNLTPIKFPIFIDNKEIRNLEAYKQYLLIALRSYLPEYEEGRQSNLLNLRGQIELKQLGGGALEDAILFREQTPNEQLHVAELLVAGFNQMELDAILIDAINRHDLNGAVSALTIGANANASDTNQHNATALHIAVHLVNLEMVKLLVINGADLNVKGIGGATALHSAVSMGNFIVAKLLIEKGANVNMKDNNGCIALHTAVAYGRLETVKLLLDKGSDAKCDASLMRSIDNRLKELTTKKHSKDIESFMEIIKLLVNKGTDFTTLQPQLAKPGIIIYASEKMESASRHELSPEHTLETNKHLLVDELQADMLKSE